MSIKVADAAQVEADAILRVEVEGVGPVALVRLEDGVYATSDICPHAIASLSEGMLEGEWLVCPTHFAEFHVKTGEVRNAPVGCPALATYPAVERDGAIFIAIPARTGPA